MLGPIGARVTNLPFAVITAAYLGVRMLAFGDRSATYFQDSYSYLEVAKLNPLSADFLAGPRPFTTPLLFKLLGSDELRIYAQLALSIVCWVALAATVARLLKNARLRPWAYAAILALSLAAWIVQWDSALLSESLSLSLMAAVTAAWLWFVERPSWPRVAAILLLSLLWAFTRDTNAFVVAFTLPLLAIALWRSRRKRLIAVALVGGIAIFAANLVSANAGATDDQRAAVLSGKPGGGFARSAELRALPTQQYLLVLHGRWEYPLLNIIGMRILPDHERVKYFQYHGMPVTPRLLQATGERGGGQNGVFFKAPELAGFRRWEEEKGQRTYLRYLVTHPDYVVSSMASGAGLVLFPREDIAELGIWSKPPDPVGAALPGPVNRLFFSHSLASGVVWALLLALAFFLALTRVPRRIWLVPATMIVITVPHMLVVWHGDALEPERHGVPVAIMARLGVLLLILFGLDANARSRLRAPLARSG
jgi:hypothetical protein